MDKVGQSPLGIRFKLIVFWCRRTKCPENNTLILNYPEICGAFCPRLSNFVIVFCNPSESVYTASERVDLAIASISKERNFTEEQLKWLGYIREHLIQNLSIDIEDFEYAPIFERYGGKGKARKVFQGQLETLIDDLNGAIAS